MRFEAVGVPDDLPVGRHPSRVEPYHQEEPHGEWIIPVVYDPTKRVEDSLIPIIKHYPGCVDPRDCDCGSVWHGPPPFVSVK